MKRYLNCVEVWTNGEEQWMARVHWGTLQEEGLIPTAVEGTIDTMHFLPSLDEAITAVMNIASDFGVEDHPDPEIWPSLSYTDNQLILEEYPAPDYAENLIHAAALVRDWEYMPAKEVPRPLPRPQIVKWFSSKIEEKCASVDAKLTDEQKGKTLSICMEWVESCFVLNEHRMENIVEQSLYEMRNGLPLKVSTLTWAKTDRELALQYIAEKKPVEIYWNEEIGGESRWSVQVFGTDFWLGSYRDPKRAISECQKNWLPIVRLIDMFGREVPLDVVLSVEEEKEGQAWESDLPVISN
jgi:hypothetical protein